MRTKTGWTFRAFAVLAALLTTVQPVLGSFAFFRGGERVDYETIHLVVGGIIYNVAIVLTVLAFFTQFRRRWILFWFCVVQYGLVHLQLRLGLGSTNDAGQLAYHVPLGVLIFFLSYLTMALAFGMRIESGRGDPHTRPRWRHVRLRTERGYRSGRCRTTSPSKRRIGDRTAMATICGKGGTWGAHWREAGRRPRPGDGTVVSRGGPATVSRSS